MRMLKRYLLVQAGNTKPAMTTFQTPLCSGTVTLLERRRSAVLWAISTITPTHQYCTTLPEALYIAYMYKPK